MKKNLMLALAILFSLPVLAGDEVKTLPAAMYDSMKSGKKLEKVFVDPSFDRAKGFKLSEVEYRDELLNSSITDALKKSIGMVVRSDSPYTLHLAIVNVTTKTFTGFGDVMGKLTVEGKILDAEGKVVVAFIAREKSGHGAGLSGAEDYSVATDKIATAIAKDLR